MIEKSSLLVLIIKVDSADSSHRMVGGPEGGELPVQGGGGDDGGHGAAEDDAHQDAATQGGRPHHPGHSRLITINTPVMTAIILTDNDIFVFWFLPWTVHEGY